MSLAYDEYLAEHIGNVNKGLHWMLDNLGLSQEEKTAIETAMVSFNHDESKYSTEEYDAYDKYFYGGNRSYKVVQDFNYAWLHHIHQNPHHWQYWVLLEDDPEAGLPYKTLPIPLPYIFEMIADWWSFSWKSGNLFEIFNWYADHRSKQIINPKSREIVEYILDRIWKVLIMQETVAGHDISEIEKQYKRFWVEQEDIQPAFGKLEYNPDDEDSYREAADNAAVTMYGNDVEFYGLRHADEEDTLIHNPTISERKAFWGKDKPPVPTIEHSGIKGQKWGVRRYQNYDGSLTEAGRKRYGKALVDTYKKYDEQKKKESGKPKVSSNPESNKYARESTKLRQDILKSSKETREILDKVKKLDLENDDDYDKAIDLAQDFKKAARKTYESVLQAYGDSSIKMPSSDYKMLDILTDKASYDDYYDLIWQNYELQHSEPEDDEDLYGIPSLKKFPMPDKRHVKSAIRFFNYVDPKYEKELAEAILEKAEEFGLDLENDITVGDENRFGKYIPSDHLAHSGRKGQKWGVQNGPPYPLDQDTVKTEYGSDAKIMESNKSGDSESDGEKKHRKSKVSNVKKELTAQANELKKEYKRLASDPNTDSEYLELVEMEINGLKEEIDARQRMAKQNHPDDYYTPVTKSLLELHPVEKLEDLKKLDDDADIEKVRNNINHPEGEGSIGRHYNCPNCAAAFELTERGYDVIARPKKTGSNVENIEDFFKNGRLSHADVETEIGICPKPPEKWSSIPIVSKKQREKYWKERDQFWSTVDIAKDEAEKSMTHDILSQGIGARGLFVVGWIDDPYMEKKTTSYHAMNYKVVKGNAGKPEIKIYDVQSGRDFKQNGEVNLGTILFDADPREVYYMRTDNLELADKITEAVYSNRKG